MAAEELVVDVDEPWAAESAAGEPCDLPVLELASAVVELELRTVPEAVRESSSYKVLTRAAMRLTRLGRKPFLLVERRVYVSRLCRTYRI